MGFLGFNGVGKIIIMWILVGYLLVISGIVKIVGYDVYENLMVVW